MHYIVIEHGGSGGTAAPLAKELFKLIIDRHEIRKNYDNNKFMDGIIVYRLIKKITFFVNLEV